MTATRRFPSSAIPTLACLVFLTIILVFGRPARSAQSDPPPKIVNTLGMEFVAVPPGRFQMGSSQEDLNRMMAVFKRVTGREYKQEWTVHVRDELPRHGVEISRPFHLQVHEVTNDQFAAFVAATGYRTSAEERGGGWTFGPDGWKPLPGSDWRHPLGPHSSIEGKGRHPVVQVSWIDAEAFIRWLGQKESRAYALPSEAQWEYACRLGQTGDLFAWEGGPAPGRRVANMPDEAYAREAGGDRYHGQGYDDGHADTAPVGSFEANALGLYDMIGNVWEWCADWYDSGYYARSPLKDPAGPAAGTHRVLRGGGYSYLPSNLRCADRFRNLPVFRCPFAGFRLILKEPG